MIVNRDRAKIVVLTTYYLTTLVCLGLSVWALYYAYLYFNLPLVLWIFLYILVVAYLVGMGILTYQKRGFLRVVIHSFAFQLIPLCCAILVFSLISKGDTYKPTPGKPNTYERSFKDMQDKQKVAAVANGLAPFKQLQQTATYSQVSAHREQPEICGARIDKFFALCRAEGARFARRYCSALSREDAIEGAIYRYERTSYRGGCKKVEKDECECLD